jgi:hypothetical protein
MCAQARVAGRCVARSQPRGHRGSRVFSCRGHHKATEGARVRQVGVEPEELAVATLVMAGARSLVIP